MKADKALHHDLTGQGAYHGRGEARCDQAQAEYRRRRMAKQRRQRQIGLIQFGDAAVAAEVERGGGGRHHRQINKTGDGHGDGHIQLGGGVALAFVAAFAALRQRRVKIDDVRHNGRAQYAGRQEDRLGSGQ